MSRVWTKIVLEWDENTEQYITDLDHSEFYDGYDGPVDACKESASEKANREALEKAQTGATLDYYQNTLPWEKQMAQQQMDLYNKTTQAQLGFENTALTQQQQQYKQYMDLMNNQFGKQNQLSDTVTNAMSPYMKGEGIGFTPAQMTALNNQGMEQISGGYSSAAQAIREMMLAHGEGGGQPLSGTAINNMATLQSGLANNTASMYNSNNLASIQQALQNKFNAAGVIGNMSGQAAGIGTSAMGAGDSALSQFGSLGSRYAVTPTQGMPGMPQMAVNANTKQPGFWEKIGDTMTGALGKGMGAFAGGVGASGADALSWLM